MAKLSLRVNGQQKEVDVDPQMPLLWAIRDFIGLTGTKFACGIAQCGACTVHVDGAPIRSCVMPVSAVNTDYLIPKLAVKGVLQSLILLANGSGNCQWISRR